MTTWGNEEKDYSRAIHYSYIDSLPVIWPEASLVIEPYIHPLSIEFNLVQLMKLGFKAPLERNFWYFIVDLLIKLSSPNAVM